MKTFKFIKISKPAESDLKDIADYTSQQWGSKQKKVYLGLIKQSFLKLCQDGVVATILIKDRKDIDIGLFSYQIGKHIVYFRETDTEILIIRILHSQMDPEKHLI